MKLENTIWQCTDVKQTELCYKTGKCSTSYWDIKIHIYKNINSTYIIKLIFNNNIEPTYSGKEFGLMIYDKTTNKVKITDSNGTYDGEIKDNSLKLTHMCYEHLKNQYSTIVKGFSATFTKNMQ